MSPLTLVVGSKNRSSWSLRPWLALREAGIPFREVVVHLDRPDTAEVIARWSPSRRVPVLHHEDLVVWDSLAIVEYVNELYPDRLWPLDRAARARARAVCAEMHAGFAPLRTWCPQDLHRRAPGPGDGPGVAADIARIHEIWDDCLARSGGPFLFGSFSAADAFYAPVIGRFRTYGKPLPPHLATWADRVWALPSMVDWLAAAATEE